MTTLAIHRNDAPSVRPLVLLAPFPLDARVWDDVVGHLDGRAITVDPPGFGASDALAEASLDAYAAAVLTALDAAGVGRFSVAGNSMGGYAAMALAALAPARLVGLALIGTKGTADDEAARANRLAMAGRAEAGTPASELVGPMLDKLVAPATRERRPHLAEHLEAWLHHAPTSGIAWAQRAMAARPDRLGTLRALEVAAVVVHGRDDALMSSEDAGRLADALRVEVTLVESGHLVPLEAPDAVAGALRPLVHAG